MLARIRSLWIVHEFLVPQSSLVVSCTVFNPQRQSGELPSDTSGEVCPRVDNVAYVKAVMYIL